MSVLHHEWIKLWVHGTRLEMRHHDQPTRWTDAPTEVLPPFHDSDVEFRIKQQTRTVYIIEFEGTLDSEAFPNENAAIWAAREASLPGSNWRVIPFKEATDHVESHRSRKNEDACRAAMLKVAPQPAPAAVPDALAYATQLARSLHQKHYAAVAPDWAPFDDLYGVLTQIDNMTTGLTAAPEPPK